MALCSACASYNPRSAAEGHALSQAGIRPGLGYIDSVAVVPHAAYRLSLHMDNGGSQTLDQDNPTFMAGERVQITAEGRVLRPPEGL